MSDIAATAVAMKQAQTVQTAQMLMVKQQHEMEMSLVSMLTEAVESAPAPAPAGMGAMVDKRA
ncbi:putative motility protein [Pelagibacterium sp.]|uniref:putative motility protein n=1 Tax=Pelagibacterium sp. TaxID=1967288 RepID=UPI003A947D90